MIALLSMRTTWLDQWHVDHDVELFTGYFFVFRQIIRGWMHTTSPGTGTDWATLFRLTSDPHSSSWGTTVARVGKITSLNAFRKLGKDICSASALSVWLTHHSWLECLAMWPQMSRANWWTMKSLTWIAKWTFDPLEQSYKYPYFIAEINVPGSLITNSSSYIIPMTFSAHAS